MTSQTDKLPIRIAVVDDDVSVRELVSNHINGLDNCKVMIQAGEGQELLDKLKTNPKIDLIILDVIMYGMDGYTTAAIIRDTYKNMRIIFYSVCKTELALSRMAASGGHGLIKKGESAAKIIEAIRSVMSGVYFFPGMEEKRIINEENFFKGTKDNLTQLSPGEIDF